MFALNTLCDRICDVISCCISSCNIGKINVYDNQYHYLKPEKDKIWKSKVFLHKAPSNRWFRNGIHSLLKRTDARGSADIIYRM